MNDDTDTQNRSKDLLRPGKSRALTQREDSFSPNQPPETSATPKRRISALPHRTSPHASFNQSFLMLSLVHRGNDTPVLGISIDWGNITSTPEAAVWSFGVYRNPSMQYLMSDGSFQQRSPYFMSTITKPLDAVSLTKNSDAKPLLYQCLLLNFLFTLHLIPTAKVCP